MTEPKTSQFHLSDGRLVGYSDIGKGENGTWIHCHGIPGSRYELSHLNDELVAAGLRVIVPDRPGYGASTPCKEYDFAQHSADVQYLADQLGLESFVVSGFSGGGVFALNLAYDLAPRIDQLVIAATPAVPLMQAPLEHASELTAGSWQAALTDVSQLADDLQALTGSDDSLREAMFSALGQDEKSQLLSRATRHAFRLNLQTAIQQGSSESAHALARDTRLITRPWPLSVEGLKMPIRIIHGNRDQLVHTPHCHALSAQLPTAEVRLFEDAGHYGVLKALFAEWKLV